MEPLFWVILTIVFLLEVWYALSHFLVLSGAKDILTQSVALRQIYFTSDLLIPFVSQYIIRQSNTNFHLHIHPSRAAMHSLYLLALYVNAAVHLVAVAGLFEMELPPGVHKWNQNVFALAELNYSNQSQSMIVMYTMGTMLDIYIHVIHSYWLGKLQARDFSIFGRHSNP